jgi:hypothetical protein
MSMPARHILSLTALMAVAVSAPSPCAAQSLRGSTASVNRMYREARREKLAFYETSSGVRRAVAAGRLVRLTPDENFTLHRVGYPYVRPATKLFVERLAAQYREACGEPLEITSAVRPATRQPANSVALSVHPTGMAVDLHKPADADCRDWLRDTLLDLERANVLEATEEFAPPHFHVAVYPSRYERYVTARSRSGPATN